MDINYKGSVQEYCQRRGLPLPQYYLLKHSGLPHSPTFQVQVEVNGQCFTGDDSCLTKKQAEQSAAQIAYDALNTTKRKTTLKQSYSQQPLINNLSKNLISPASILPSYPSLSTNNSMKHMPLQYADSEQSIIDIIDSEGGRIRKIWAPDEQGRYQFEITGTYRYCENIHQHHRKNHIYFIVDPVYKTYYQKCHDPQCFGFESAIKKLSKNLKHTPIKRKKPAASMDYSIFVKHLKQEIE